MSSEEKTKLILENIFHRMVLGYDFMSLVMYPELTNRRQFVHDAWLIAKMTENVELKISISNDPYFYITREDILILLQTHDDDMIHHMLAHEIMLMIEEDVSYKLVLIKGAQVNYSQQTVVQLVDFISVLVTCKRKDKYDSSGKVLFTHSDIVDFLEIHKEFLIPTQAIKVFIISRKFRLSL